MQQLKHVKRFNEALNHDEPWFENPEQIAADLHNLVGEGSQVIVNGRTGTIDFSDGCVIINLERGVINWGYVDHPDFPGEISIRARDEKQDTLARDPTLWANLYYIGCRGQEHPDVDRLRSLNLVPPITNNGYYYELLTKPVPEPAVRMIVESVLYDLNQSLWTNPKMIQFFQGITHANFFRVTPQKYILKKYE